MKAVLSPVLFLIFIILSFPGYANSPVDDEENYCYKPSEPLLFSSVSYKKRYTEDLQEYLRCKQSYNEMQQRVATMKSEAEKNAQRVKELYESKKNID